MDLFSLADRTALVTGGSRGIGKMIVRGLLQAGAKVYLSSRKVDACNAAAEELSAFGSCHALPADISQTEGIRHLADTYAGYEDKLDILVNNAGAAWLEEFATFPEKGWDKIMDLNVRSPFFLTQALLPLLKRAASAERPAKVINIASVDGIAINPQQTYSYAASKAALIQLTRRMALRLVEDNVVVSAIAPGAFVSDMNILARDKPEEVAQIVPARRIGRPDDMAGAAIYLASRAGDYVVGSTLIVDGGVSHGRKVV